MKTKRFFITAGEGAYPKRRRVVKEFKTKKEAQDYITKLRTPGKINYGGVRQTAYRDAVSGVGIVNPRIIIREVNR